MARLDKAAAVKEIKNRFDNSSAAVLTEYRGLTVGEMHSCVVRWARTPPTPW